MDAAAAKHSDRSGGYRPYYRDGFHHGLCQQPDIAAYLFII
jgi:hypothetical protein